MSGISIGPLVPHITRCCVPRLSHYRVDVILKSDLSRCFRHLLLLMTPSAILSISSYSWESFPSFIHPLVINSSLTSLSRARSRTAISYVIFSPTLGIRGKRLLLIFVAGSYTPPAALLPFVTPTRKLLYAAPQLCF